MLLNNLDNPIERCELKFAGNGLSAGQFEAYASVFDGNDAFKDTIKKGAFSDTLKKRARPVRMFFQHNPSVVIGKWLDLHEDSKGLKSVGEFTPGNTNADNVHASMKHGAIDSLSIGYRIPKGGYTNKTKDCDCDPDDWCMHATGRIITKVDLVEISPVTLPADDKARVSQVKLETITSLKDAELMLRDSAMFTRKMATAFVSQLKALCQSESDAELNEQIAELKSRLAGHDAAVHLKQMLDRYSLENLVS